MKTPRRRRERSELSRDTAYARARRLRQVENLLARKLNMPM